MTHTFLPPVIIGMGFSRQKSAINLKEILDYFIQEHQYTLKFLALPAFKQQDNNAIMLQTLMNVPVYYIAQQTLKDLQPQCQSYSSIVAKHTGLGAVSEACVLATMNKNDYLLIPKMIYNGISFSIAIQGDPS